MITMFENYKNLDLSDEKSIIKFIKETESDIAEGKDSEGNQLIVALDKEIGLRITTFQNNGWMRIMDYDYDRENDELTISESYSK